MTAEREPAIIGVLVSYFVLHWALSYSRMGMQQKAVMVDVADRLSELIPQSDLAAFCRRWRVRELALFGSVLRDDFGPTSDVDVLVSFDDDAPWSLWDLTAMQDELSGLLGRQVDLVEREGLRNPFRRDRILSTRRVVYVAGQG